LQVFFRKRATNFRALLQKMNNKDKASYRSSPPSIKVTVCLVFKRHIHTQKRRVNTQKETHQYTTVPYISYTQKCVCICVCVCVCVCLCLDIVYIETEYTQI